MKDVGVEQIARVAEKLAVDPRDPPDGKKRIADIGNRVEPRDLPPEQDQPETAESSQRQSVFRPFPHRPGRSRCVRQRVVHPVQEPAPACRWRRRSIEQETKDEYRERHEQRTFLAASPELDVSNVYGEAAGEVNGDEDEKGHERQVIQSSGEARSRHSWHLIVEGI